MATYRVTYFRTTTQQVIKVINADTADHDALFELALAVEEDEETIIKEQDCDCELAERWKRCHQPRHEQHRGGWFEISRGPHRPLRGRSVCSPK